MLYDGNVNLIDSDLCQLAVAKAKAHGLNFKEWQESMLRAWMRR